MQQGVLKSSPSDGVRQRIRDSNRRSETEVIGERLRGARVDTALQQRIQSLAVELATAARAQIDRQSGLGAFMREYDLSSPEGVLLMCIAEALLRIPDADTIDLLIQDRLSRGEWDRHLGHSHSILVNASTWGLLLTGQLYTHRQAEGMEPQRMLKQLIARSGSGLVRAALQRAVGLLAEQFVVAETMEEAVRNSAGARTHEVYSYDCLGEAALTRQDVETYYHAYRHAIDTLAASTERSADENLRASVSIKLSALHPRYEYRKSRRVIDELVPRLSSLAVLAAEHGIGITVDAEEADRLELQLDVFAAVYRGLPSSEWQDFGIAVQAYQKRALPVLEWLQALAEVSGRVIPVRLVKGAYWDTEIKRAQEMGLDGYPVFTRKAATDVSYLACARYLLERAEGLYPQFASHNAYTLAWIAVVGAGKAYELQRLQGMGEELYEVSAAVLGEERTVRVYSPVGDRHVLLPYLVRRLLENGANTSFVNQLAREDIAIEQLVADPCDSLQRVALTPHPRIPLPRDIFGAERRNARGMDLSDPDIAEALLSAVNAAAARPWVANAQAESAAIKGSWQSIVNPANTRQVVGHVYEVDAGAVSRALAGADDALKQGCWADASARVECLLNTATRFEQQAADLIARIVREGGRSLPDAIAEVREAVDFCRYYAHRARLDFSAPMQLPGLAGESNQLQLHGRGVFACISPWNFPLAIFTGQVAAALVAGNAVLAKPARQTALTGAAAVDLFHAAGVPADILQLLPGSGTGLGEALFQAPQLAGVAFTGSTGTAKYIQRALADREGPIVPLIAETGGQNVMIADSSALPEQLVVDVISSAFNSAGQRCSALRVLFVQQEIADTVIRLLQGAMEELQIGDPIDLASDIGPVINASAIRDLRAHISILEGRARRLQAISPAAGLEQGTYFSVYAYEIDDLSLLQEEVFGPVLHVIRYAGNQLDKVIDAVNRTGYGLTLGVHSRIESTWQRVRQKARVGNLYINRDMIGAAVGRQPFGGERLSGTGPKAGGPYYLHRFATERTVSVNTSATGGDSELLSMGDE